MTTQIMQEIYWDFGALIYFLFCLDKFWEGIGFLLAAAKSIFDLEP
jgi:hypothetical protein